MATEGDLSTGIFAESVGGGGGRGGSSGGFITVGGSGSGGGNAKKVDVNHSGNITTKGNYAKGIYAHSVGGGGGAGGDNVAIGPFVSTSVGGSGGTGGDGGPVNVTLNGSISTGVPTSTGQKGYKSVGVYAQSVGGGGGAGGGSISVAAGAFGAVSVGVGGSTVKADKAVPLQSTPQTHKHQQQSRPEVKRLMEYMYRV